LSDKGRQEAVEAGKAIKDAGLKFDVAHTSVLKRANLTLDSILAESGQTGIPIQKTWRLNERHYGGLTGMDKAETAKKYGEDQVKIWRRSFDTPPPPMDTEHKYYKAIVEDPIYSNGPSKEEFPMFESLKLTILRTLPYWNDVIIPQLKEGKQIIIAAHGNSLRGIVKHLDCTYNFLLLKRATFLLTSFSLISQQCPMMTLWVLICPLEFLSSMNSMKTSSLLFP